MDFNTLLKTSMRLVQAGRLDEAKKNLQILLQHNKKNPDVLHLLGLVESQRGNNAEAVRLIKKAIKLFPKAAIYHKNIAGILAQTGKQEVAVRHLRQASVLDRNDPDPHNQLGVIFSVQGKSQLAIEEYKKAIIKKTKNPNVYNNLANEYVTASEYDEALKNYDIALQLQPDFWTVLNNKASVYLALRQYHHAIDCANEALELNPDSTDAYLNLNFAHEKLGQYEQALRCCEKVVSLNDQLPEAFGNLGKIYKTIGNPRAALEAVNRAIELKPDYAEAFFIKRDLSLSSVYNADELEFMKSKAEEKATSPRDRVMYYFSLAYGFERLGIQEDLEDQDELGVSSNAKSNYLHAAAYFDKANQLKSSMVEYDLQQEAENYLKLQQAFTPELFKKLKRSENNDDSPIFIVGLPRSGKTVLENSLAQHDLVEAEAESEELLLVVSELFEERGLAFPDDIAQLDDQLISEIGKQFLQRIKVKHGDAKRITFTLPKNTLYIGLIALALPQAKVISVQRTAKDNCLQIYKKSFVEDVHAYSYQQETIIQRYKLHHHLMAHWESVLPGKICTVDFDQLLKNPEQELRRVLEFCDLEWSENCLDWFKQDENRPTVKNSTELWKPYQEYWPEFFAEIDSMESQAPPSVTN